MSIRKISNKKLSRNFKTRKAPLRVLPMATFHTRHPLKQNIKKQKTEETKPTPLPPSTIQCTVEKVIRTTGKRVKNLGEKGQLPYDPL